MSTMQQLLDRRLSLQAEQQEWRQAVGALRGRLAELEAARASALRRYDVGVDDAAIEASAALDEIIGIEKSVAKAERYLSEYPARIESLNAEIEAAGYRDKCKTLLALTAQERTSWAKVAATMPAFFEAWHEFEQIRLERTVLARSLANFAGARGLSAPIDHQVNAPTTHDIAHWLELRPVAAMAQVQAAVEKASR